MKKILLSLVLLATLVSPTVAHASTVDITAAQNTLFTCWNSHTKSVACTNAFKVVNAWKPTKGTPAITVNQNILIKCVYSKTPHTPACVVAAKYVQSYENGAANVAQAKSDVHEVAVAISGGFGTGDLTTSDNTGKTALKGKINYGGGISNPVGKVTAYVNLNAGKFCVSETVGSTTFKATESSSVGFGTPCKSANG